MSLFVVAESELHVYDARPYDSTVGRCSILYLYLEMKNTFSVQESNSHHLYPNAIQPSRILCPIFVSGSC